MPNLIFLLSTFSWGPFSKIYDEGFLGKEQQLWINYSDSNEQAFSGVLATKNSQKKIQGIKNGDSISFWSTSEKWEGFIERGVNPCRSYLRVQPNEVPTESWVLWLDKCLA